MYYRLAMDGTCTARVGGGKRAALGALMLGFAWAVPSTAFASASLQISPVLLEVPAGGAASNVTIANQDSRPADIQVRLFKWTQADGEETLTPTEDVVASPPIATIQPHSKLTVRVIRVATGEVASEEAYRLVIDQLPQSDAGGRAIVSMLVRQVLPLFFEPAERASADVAWSLARTPRGWALRARNSGDRRMRIAKVVLSGGGAPVAMGGGLLGYALAHSEMSWTLPARGAHFSPGGRVSLGGDSDVGALHATATVSAGE
jgi:fimbrial chaperone protein